LQQETDSSVAVNSTKSARLPFSRSALRWGTLTLNCMKSFAATVLILVLCLAAAVGDDKRLERAMPMRSGQGLGKAAADLLKPSPAEQAFRVVQQHQVHDLFEVDDAPQALACLARMLRVNPNNQLAADRLMAAMSQRSFVLPLAKALHPNQAVQTLKYSDDGQLIATTDEDFSLGLWSGTSGVAVKRPSLPRQGVHIYEWLIPRGYISISAEHHRSGEHFHILQGALYVTMVSELAGGTFKTEQTSTIHLSAQENALLSVNATNIVTACSENAVSIWDTQTGRLLASSPPLESTISDALFLLDSWRLILVSDKGLSIWDPGTNTLQSRAFQYADQIEQVALSPDGKWLLGWGEDKIALWNAETGEFHGTIREWSRFPSDIPFFGSSGGYVVTTGTGGTVRIWDASTCHPVTPTLTHFDATFKVRADAALSPDNRWLATVVPDYDNTLRIWDVAKGKLLNNPIQEACSSVVFAPDGQELATLSGESAPRFWQLKAADRMWLPSRFNEALSYPQACREGDLLGVERHEGTLPGLIDLRTGRVQARISLPLKDVTGAAVCPSGHCFLTVHEDQTVRTWDAASGRPLRVLSGANLQTRRATARYSPDHQAILVFDVSWASEEPNLYLWNLASPSTTPHELRHSEGVYDADFSQDGQWIATACRDGTVHIWSRASGAPALPPLKHESRVTSVQFSPAGRHLLTTSEGKAHLWNLATGREAFPPRQHEYHFVEKHMDQFVKMFATFSPDGKRIATASGFTARVWDAQTGTAVLEPLKHPSWVEDVEFSRDGSRLVTTCADRGVRVWDASTGVQIGEAMQVRSEYVFSFSAQFSLDGKWIVATTPGSFASPLEWTVWEVPHASCPLPLSFLDLAEALGGERLDETGMSRPVPWQNLLKLRQQLTASPEPGEHGQWARWFFDDQPTRKLTPHARLTFLEYIQQRIQLGTAGALREALSLSPTNAVAMTRLAQSLSQNLESTRGRAFWPQQDRPGIAREARFWARRALQLANQDPEIRSACADVLRALSASDRSTETSKEREVP
jgi:WD40 repeat protein